MVETTFAWSPDESSLEDKGLNLPIEVARSPEGTIYVIRIMPIPAVVLMFQDVASFRVFSDKIQSAAFHFSCRAVQEAESNLRDTKGLGDEI